MKELFGIKKTFIIIEKKMKIRWVYIKYENQLVKVSNNHKNSKTIYLCH